MQRHVQIFTSEATLPIPDNQLDKYQLTTDILDEIERERMYGQDGDMILLPVLNLPMKCYQAVVNYVTHCIEENIYAPASVQPTNMSGITITPKEAAIVSPLKTRADFRLFFQAAHYLGNGACMAFATKNLLRCMAIEQLVSSSSM